MPELRDHRELPVQGVSSEQLAQWREIIARSSGSVGDDDLSHWLGQILNLAHLVRRALARQAGGSTDNS